MPTLVSLATSEPSSASITWERIAKKHPANAVALSSFNCLLPAHKCTQFASCSISTGKCSCPDGFGGDDCLQPRTSCSLSHIQAQSAAANEHVHSLRIFGRRQRSTHAPGRYLRMR